jgi:hypothetical protein
MIHECQVNLTHLNFAHKLHKSMRWLEVSQILHDKLSIYKESPHLRENFGVRSTVMAPHC